MSPDGVSLTELWDTTASVVQDQTASIYTLILLYTRREIDIDGHRYTEANDRLRAKTTTMPF